MQVDLAQEQVDEEAGEHEEDVEGDEPARIGAEAGVEDYDREHGQARMPWMRRGTRRRPVAWERR